MMVHASDVNAIAGAQFRGMLLDATPADRRELAELRTENALLKAELRGVGRVYDRIEAENTLLRQQLADQRTTACAIHTTLLDYDWLAAVAKQAWLEATPLQPTGRLISDALFVRLNEEADK